MVREYRFALPPFCGFTPEEWAEKGHEYDEIRDNMLGWDITDYGMGDFDKMGFSLITLRNGNLKLDQYTKTYAEKLLYIKEGQYSPMHFHWSKMEDIINRGGGNVLIRVYHSTPTRIWTGSGRSMSMWTAGRWWSLLGPGAADPGGEHHHLSLPLPRLYRGARFRSGAAGRGEPVQRRQHRQPLQSPCGPLPHHRGGRAPYRLLCNEYPAAE